MLEEAQAIRGELEVPHVGLPEDDLADVVDRHHAQVLHDQEALHVAQLAEDGVARRLAVRRGQHLVVGGTQVAREVGEGRLRLEQGVEVVVGVGDVGRPPRHGGEHVLLAEVAPPLGDVQDLHLGLQAEVLAQHVGDDLRRQLGSEAAGVRAEEEGREALAIREARVGEELLGLHRVEGHGGEGSREAREARREDPAGRLVEPLERRAHELRAVHGHRDRPTDADVLEGGIRGLVEGEEHGGGPRVLDELRGVLGVRLEPRVLRARHLDQVQLARLVLLDPDGGVGDDLEDDLRHARAPAEVRGVGGQHDPAPERPLDELVGPGAVRVGRAPALAAPLDGVLRHDGGGRMGQADEEVTLGPVHPDLDLARAHGPHPAEPRRLPGLEVLEALDGGEEELRVGRVGLGVGEAVE